ncbi:hypothetical protein ACFCZV_36015 [Streptomyces hydrogenans]|uniref:hypothetical protein n=1 Tax=Streptomyces hydrogenans TaxID=1873719 RepID=UPI0035DC662C
MDVEQVTDELYALRPSEFTAARDAYVAEARRAKDRAAARAIAALRRPPLAVWAANLLARERPEEAERFLAVGEALREAHRTLDGERLREAGRQRHRLVAALVRTAAALAEEAGQPVSDPVLREVEQILHAVLAHPEVAEPWAKGRLTALPETAVGFPGVPPETLTARASAAPKDRAPARDEERKAEKAERAEKAEKAEPAERAERARAAEEARTGLARRERERDAAREAATAAAAAAEEAAERLRRAEQEGEEAAERLRRAEREREEAAEAAAGAERAAGEAGAALRAAEQALDGARDAVARADEEVRRYGRAERGRSSS